MDRNALDKYITDVYGAKGEYMWEKHPSFAVYRHQNNKKWFAVIMEISKSKIGIDSDGSVNVVNLKCDPLLIGSLLFENGIHKGYHMNKNYWITVRLDGSVEDDKIKWLLDMSFDLTMAKIKRNKVKKQMELSKFFKSVIDQDTAPVVICDLEHIVVYMNPASIARYHTDLTGKSLKACHNADANAKIDRVVAWFAKSKENNIVYTSRNDKENKDVYMVALRDDDGTLIGYYEKHEYRNRETAKTYNTVK